MILAQKLQAVMTHVGALLASAVDVDPESITNSNYSVKLGLERIEKDHLQVGMLLAAPGKTLSSGKYDDSSFASLSDLIFLQIINRSQATMDCRFLGVEGESEVLVSGGILKGDILTLVIPDFSLVCKRFFTQVFPDILGDDAISLFDASTRPLAVVAPTVLGLPQTGSPSGPRASSTQLKKLEDFRPIGLLIEPRSKYLRCFPDSNVDAASAFEPSIVETMILEAHASHSQGLKRSLLSLSETELWVVACLRGGNSSKPFPLLKFRSPLTPEPTSALGAIGCLLLVASVSRAFHGMYVAALILACHESLTWLVTASPDRFAAEHIVETFDKVLVSLRLCAASDKDAHLAAARVNEETPFIRRHLRDDQQRYNEAGSSLPPWGGAGGGGNKPPAGGGGGGKGGGKHTLPGPAAPTAASKRLKQETAYKTWRAQDPLPGLDICRSWASSKGQCAKAKAAQCSRAHQYPPSVTAADQQAFKDWCLAKP